VHFSMPPVYQARELAAVIEIPTSQLLSTSFLADHGTHSPLDVSLNPSIETHALTCVLCKESLDVWKASKFQFQLSPSAMQRSDPVAVYSQAKGREAPVPLARSGSAFVTLASEHSHCQYCIHGVGSQFLGLLCQTPCINLCAP